MRLEVTTADEIDARLASQMTAEADFESLHADITAIWDECNPAEMTALELQGVHHWMCLREDAHQATFGFPCPTERNRVRRQVAIRRREMEEQQRDETFQREAEMWCNEGVTFADTSSPVTPNTPPSSDDDLTYTCDEPVPLPPARDRPGPPNKKPRTAPHGRATRMGHCQWVTLLVLCIAFARLQPVEGTPEEMLARAVWECSYLFGFVLCCACLIWCCSPEQEHPRRHGHDYVYPDDEYPDYGPVGYGNRN